jgi:hypothetical protein
MTSQIVVKTHVARDLLQSAALFKTDKLVVWEYVSNGLDYVEPGVNPVIRVQLDSKNKKITITDNGRGMNWAGLENYFVMHGENIDRKAGRAGRGRFGTGKSAAFGIADLLRISTVHGHKRSKVELKRSDVETTNSGEPIPVKTLEREVSIDEPNGTVVEIEGIHLRSLDQSSIISYIERHLAKYPRNVTVFVNHHQCEYNEPPVSQKQIFKPAASQSDRLGDVELIVKVAKRPLDQDERGISIFSKGVWYETTLAGNEGREMSQYIFGEIDIPALDQDKSPIPPFDMSRSMQLNPSNELVQLIYAFVGEYVDKVRRSLVEEEKRRKQTEEAKKLEKAAHEIAQILNQDFDSFRHKLAKVKAKAVGGTDLEKYSLDSGQNLEDLIFGAEMPAKQISAEGSPGNIGQGNNSGTIAPERKPEVETSNESIDNKGRPSGGKGIRPRARGGFNVAFRNNGTESPRAQYEREDRTIYINLDHPQVESAKGDMPTENPIFRNLVNEIAFTEYAIGLAQELISRDEYIEILEPVVDIRETINRLAIRAAGLYANKAWSNS